MLKNLFRLLFSSEPILLRARHGRLGDLGGIVGSVVGGIFGNQAADAQGDAAAAAANAQLTQYGQTRSDQMPWLQAGGGAINQLAYLMGLTPFQPQTSQRLERFTPGYQQGGGAHRPHTGGMPTLGSGPPGTQSGQPYYGQGPAGGQPGIPVTQNYAGGGFGSLATPFGMQQFQQDPGYQFRLDEGMKALERSQSAKGGLLSGAAGKAMLGYGQGMGSQEYGAAFDRYRAQQSDLYNRLAGISGTGQTTAQGLGQLGQSAAANAGNAYIKGGEAEAAGYGNLAGNIQTGLGSLFGKQSGGGGWTPFGMFS